MQGRVFRLVAGEWPSVFLCVCDVRVMLQFVVRLRCEGDAANVCAFVM